MTSEGMFKAKMDLQVAKLRLAAAEDAGDLAAARDAVERALQATEEFVGECQLVTPWASTFLVFESGRSRWKCTHAKDKGGPHYFDT